MSLADANWPTASDGKEPVAAIGGTGAPTQCGQNDSPEAAAGSAESGPAAVARRTERWRSRRRAATSSALARRSERARFRSRGTDPDRSGTREKSSVTLMRGQQRAGMLIALS